MTTDQPAPRRLSDLETFIVKVGVVLTAFLIFVFVTGTYVEHLVARYSIDGLRGGSAFWKGAETSLLKLADSPDLPADERERMLTALRKLSARYAPYVNAVTSGAKPPER